MSNDFSNRKCTIGTHFEQKRISSKRIDITIGVFFDGTGNNKYNYQYARDVNKNLYKEDNSSYYGSFTNVAQLWFLYDTNNQYTEKVYIEGPGTVAPVRAKENIKHKDRDNNISSTKVDNDDGLGFGASRYGVNAKIECACKLIKEKVESLLSEKRSVMLKSITLDVFGFSRGAASARSFVSRINGHGTTETEGYKVSLRGDHLTDDIYKKTKIIIRFMGLFDTVSSYQYLATEKENKKIKIEAGASMRDKVSTKIAQGINASSQLAKKYYRIINNNFDNDVKELGLTIPPDVLNVVHLVAANEYRSYFSLTTIMSAQNSKGTFLELALPGAHSDIGGGYASVVDEYLYGKNKMPSMAEVKNTEYRKFRGYLSFSELLQEKWITPGLYKYALDQFKAYHKVLQNARDPSVNRIRFEHPYRRVRNDYAKIPLYIMYKYALNSNVLFQKLQNSNKQNNPSVEKVLIIPNDDQELIQLNKVGNVLKKEAMAKRSRYSIGNSDIYYTSSISEKDIKTIRWKFIHLSAETERAWGVNKANPFNKRTIIPG